MVGRSALLRLRGCGRELRVFEEQLQALMGRDLQLEAKKAAEAEDVAVELWGYWARHIEHSVVFIPQSCLFRTMT